MDRFYRKARPQVLERDPICQYCQAKPSETVDHPISVIDTHAAVSAGLISKEAAKKQLNNPDKMLGVCVSCNSSKQGRLPGNIAGTWEPPQPTIRAIDLMKEFGTWDD